MRDISENTGGTSSFPPNSLRGSLRVLQEICVAVGEVALDGRARFVRGSVIAVVDDGAGHPAKHGFYNAKNWAPAGNGVVSAHVPPAVSAAALCSSIRCRSLRGNAFW